MRVDRERVAVADRVLLAAGPAAVARGLVAHGQPGVAARRLVVVVGGGEQVVEALDREVDEHHTGSTDADTVGQIDGDGVAAAVTDGDRRQRPVVAVRDGEADRVGRDVDQRHRRMAARRQVEGQFAHLHRQLGAFGCTTVGTQVGDVDPELVRPRRPPVMQHPRPPGLERAGTRDAPHLVAGKSRVDGVQGAGRGHELHRVATVAAHRDGRLVGHHRSRAHPRHPELQVHGAAGANGVVVQARVVGQVVEGEHARPGHPVAQRVGQARAQPPRAHARHPRPPVHLDVEMPARDRQGGIVQVDAERQQHVQRRRPGGSGDHPWETVGGEMDDRQRHRGSSGTGFDT